MEDFLESTASLIKVGQGFCGTVWAEDTGGTLVIKRADGGPGRSLPNEHHIHTRILAAVAHDIDSSNNAENEKIEKTKLDKKNEDDKENCEDQFRIRVNIPFDITFLDNDSTLWSKILPKLPKGFESCEALISERIPPMKLAAREVLAGRYCPSKQHAASMARDKSNESCLIRPYLGRRRPAPDQRGGPKQRFFSLRNFPLHIDQMEELDLPVEEYAAAMADALAFLHWSARIDAGDVEYVLAPPRSNSMVNLPSIGSKGLFSEVLGSHSMWILDFDCCKELELNVTGMRRAAMCFWRNDPFYPRPGAKSERDSHLWNIFQTRFLQRSGVLLKDESVEVRSLPGVLLQIIRDNRDTWTKGAMV